MSTARRRFLHNAAIAAVAALAVPLRVVSAASAVGTTSNDVDHDSMVPLIASDFKVSQGGTQLASLQLVAVNRPASLKGYRDPQQAARNTFTLIFRSEQPSTLKEGIYTFSSPRHAAFSAFISPINGDQRTYQIVYNRNAG
ncbi:MAG: hypothetical protein P4L92_05730 [Rudaea sp.]|nr:hypothetical protein [Rudaea sp.]